MGNVLYGRKAIGMPTPANLVFWCRVYTIVGAGIITAVKTAPFIDTGSILQQSIEWWFTSTIAICNILLPMAGVNIKSDTVPTEAVKSIEPEVKP